MRSVAVDALAEPWALWPTRLHITVAPDFALEFAFDEAPPLRGDLRVVFVSNTLYVVPAAQWSPAIARTEAAVRSVALARLLPLH